MRHLQILSCEILNGRVSGWALSFRKNNCAIIPANFNGSQLASNFKLLPDFKWWLHQGTLNHGNKLFQVESISTAYFYSAKLFVLAFICVLLTKLFLTEPAKAKDNIEGECWKLPHWGTIDNRHSYMSTSTTST
jgi:hypothetical protein